MATTQVIRSERFPDLDDEVLFPRINDAKLAWLASRGEEYAHAFKDAKVIRAAIDQRHVKPDAAIKGAREIAFFPPMTGG